ncbi:HypC/HybG/HupF family hydrogenase formation chaperone [Palleronia sp. KMU-117]|uniref:HypC/HybG/HupF family hydrogenase formation chaperone n=1 Tax=Palleronia sp. KMU-117 TaxID=3434108 RepID=UPI003D747529
MCVGIPMQIVSADGFMGRATDGTREVALDLALTGPLPAGTWVLTFLGAAREVITEAEAALISDALGALARIMAGGEAGDAFADLDRNGPRLPPHLAAAHAAGRHQA